jgi:hypothetical protein
MVLARGLDALAIELSAADYSPTEIMRAAARLRERADRPPGPVEGP